MVKFSSLLEQGKKPKPQHFHWSEYCETERILYGPRTSDSRNPVNKLSWAESRSRLSQLGMSVPNNASKYDTYTSLK